MFTCCRSTGGRRPHRAQQILWYCRSRPTNRRYRGQGWGICPAYEKNRCGRVIEPLQSAALAQVISALASDRAETIAMGQQARVMLEAQFTRQKAFERWREVFERLARDP